MAISKLLKLDKSNAVEIPLDSHIGLLVGVVHLGVQKNTYQGVTSLVDQVLLQFELQDILTDKGSPITVSKIVRLSMKSKANLPGIVKYLGANIQDGFDFHDLIGKPIMVNMGQNLAKTKTVIKDFGPLPKLLQKEVKSLVGTPRVYLDVDEITESQKSELSEWIRKLIDSRVTSESGNTSDDSIEL